MSRRRATAFLSIGFLSFAAMAALLQCGDDDNTSTPKPDSSTGTDTGTGTDTSTGTDTGGQDTGTNDAGDAGDAGSGLTILALDDTGKIVKFKSGAPGTLIGGALTVSGLQAADALVGIDIRPLDGNLYAVGKLGYLYSINKTTGAATAINNAPFAVLTGTHFGVDFNPTVDRLRIHSDTGQNLRVNPTNGTLAATDTNLAYAPADVNTGKTPEVSGAGYTNSLAPTPSTTVLYAIDTKENVLVTVNPPNAGTLNTVGSLTVDAAAMSGFDIYGGQAGDGAAPIPAAIPTQAFAVMQTTQAQLFTVNLQTGAATLVGNVGHNAPILGIAIEP